MTAPLTAAVLLEPLERYLAAGGSIMGPLVASGLVLWYVIGFRALRLRRGSGLTLERLVAGRGPDVRRVPPARGVLDGAVDAALDARGAARSQVDLRARLAAALAPVAEQLDRGTSLARTIVAVSPLLGLLGTVTGMIEMFDSLGSGSFHAQEGGIAQGIAEALYTTELGLMVAIPGLFLTRVLDRRATTLRAELARLEELVQRAPLAAQGASP